jgi:hypothetical protein
MASTLKVCPIPSRRCRILVLPCNVNLLTQPRSHLHFQWGVGDRFVVSIVSAFDFSAHGIHRFYASRAGGSNIYSPVKSLHIEMQKYAGGDGPLFVRELFATLGKFRLRQATYVVYSVSAASNATDSR